MSRHSQSGATLVEVLVAIALVGVMMPTMVTALVTSHAGRASSRQQLRATALLHETTEAVRAVREDGWGTVATNGVYHPVISGTGWTLASGAETVDGFTRQVTISTAQRDSSGVLVASGGTDDPGAKHVVVDVSWTTPYSASISDDLYLTRWQGNQALAQTTQSDFTAGTATNTVVTNVGGGEVELDGAPTYQTSGTFESDSFDAGATVAFNSLFFTAAKPAGSDIQFQIATNTDNSTWTYVGPDGTNGTYFTADSAVPLALAEGRYFRFKAFLTGDGTVTPTLSDVTVSYSP